MTRHIAFFLFISLLLGSCFKPKEEVKKTIAISWFYPKNDYQNWIHSQDESFEFIELYSVPYDQIDSILDISSALILTGGPDISPIVQGVSDSLSLCGKPDPKRDSVESIAAKYALENKIPTLGVCRGMQMLNLISGGTLYLDIPSQLGSNLHKVDSGDAHHYVYRVNDFFKNKFDIDSGYTNSNHHQGIDVIGENWIVDGISKDSVIEAIHFSDTIDHPFLRAVQWHPERMDRESNMSKNILSDFLKAIDNEN